MPGEIIYGCNPHWLQSNSVKNIDGSNQDVGGITLQRYFTAKKRATDVNFVVRENQGDSQSEAKRLNYSQRQVHQRSTTLPEWEITGESSSSASPGGLKSNCTGRRS